MAIPRIDQIEHALKRELSLLAEKNANAQRLTNVKRLQKGGSATRRD
jgi:hypothetical protein